MQISVLDAGDKNNNNNNKNQRRGVCPQDTHNLKQDKSMLKSK